MKPIITIILLIIIQSTSAQTFFKATNSTISTNEIILSNYSVLKLDAGLLKEKLLNVFDYKNVYTTLQLIKDNSGNIFHVLYQTNFEGKIIFLSYSNNLQKIIINPNKPSFQFEKCIKQINEGFSSSQVSQDAINCILNRLNYSSQ